MRMTYQECVDYLSDLGIAFCTEMVQSLLCHVNSGLGDTIQPLFASTCVKGSGVAFVIGQVAPCRIVSQSDKYVKVRVDLPNLQRPTGYTQASPLFRFYESRSTGDVLTCGHYDYGNVYAWIPNWKEGR